MRNINHLQVAANFAGFIQANYRTWDELWKITEKPLQIMYNYEDVKETYTLVRNTQDTIKAYDQEGRNPITFHNKGGYARFDFI